MTATQSPEVSTRNLTIKQFAALTGLEYIEASVLVKVLVKVGAAKENGKEANPPGVRGKPSVIYAIEDGITLDFWDGEETAPVVPATPEVPEAPEASVNNTISQIVPTPSVPITSEVNTIVSEVNEIKNDEPVRIVA